MTGGEAHLCWSWLGQQSVDAGPRRSPPRQRASLHTRGGRGLSGQPGKGRSVRLCSHPVRLEEQLKVIESFLCGFDRERALVAISHLPRKAPSSVWGFYSLP